MSEYIVVHGIRIAKDFVPETFGRLTTIGPKFRLPVGAKAQARNFQVCECSCGSIVFVCCSNLVSGHTKSCGCLQKQKVSEKCTKHGKSKTSIHCVWRTMRDRCNNHNSASYYSYGGRGISVHPDWDNPDDGFQNFYDYMGPKPTPEHEVDRYPNRNGNYEPGNVRWATRKEQQRNLRSNVELEFDGKKQCIASWAEETGITRAAIVKRIKLGWSVEDTLTKPVRGTKNL